MFKNILIKTSIIFIVLSYMLDPTGELYNLKYISTGIVFIIFTFIAFFSLRELTFSQLQFIYLFIYCFIIPIYGTAITFFYSDLTTYLDSSYIGFSICLILLAPIVVIEKGFFFHLLIDSVRILSYIIIIILFSFIYDGDQLGISQFFIDHKSMLVGFREYAGITTYYLYFTAAPLLLILVSYDAFRLMENRNFISFFSFIVSAIALFLSGTRFNMLIAILILPFVIFIYKYKKKYLFTYTLIFFLLIGIVFQNSFTNSFFDSKESSNNVKTGYLDYYSSIFSDPSFFLFGQGFNGQDWSYKFKNMLLTFSNEGTKTELTYLELIRVFGIVIGSLINISLLCIPFFIYWRYKKINYKFVSVTLYLISAALNPYLFSTNGVIIFLFILTEFNKQTIDNFNNKVI